MRSQPGDSLAQQVYKTLLGRLLGGELVPGEMLNRREVAARLGVSVAPVLEAMLQLEMEGYLEGIPRKGTRVRPIRTDDVVGQLIVREALECAAARIYCGKKVTFASEYLAEAAKKLDDFSDESVSRWEAEIAFHQGLVRLTECEPLIRECQRNLRLVAFYRINRVVGGIQGLTVDRHSRLLETLKGADPDRAERAIRDHIRSGKGHLLGV